MALEVRTSRTTDGAHVNVLGLLDLASAPQFARALSDAERGLAGVSHAVVDLTAVDRLHASGAVLLTGLVDRLEQAGTTVTIATGDQLAAPRLIALHRRHSVDAPAVAADTPHPLARLGVALEDVATSLLEGLATIGRYLAVLPRVARHPGVVDWRSLPRLVQHVGADGLPVAAAASVLVGVIIGLLGVSQLGRFGATAYVPELVVVAYFRELGPLVTAIVMAGRSGAGLASELAAMKVSEEVDALRTLGIDPTCWLVVPRCLALLISIPLLTWIGDGLAVVGGLAATVVTTDMPAVAYLRATEQAISATHLFIGLVKTPFLALAIGVIACGHGLAATGGAAAVGARTTMAVVQSIFGVIAISALFTAIAAAVGL